MNQNWTENGICMKAFEGEVVEIDNSEFEGLNGMPNLSTEVKVCSLRERTARLLKRRHQ